MLFVIVKLASLALPFNDRHKVHDKKCKTIAEKINLLQRYKAGSTA